MKIAKAFLNKFVGFVRSNGITLRHPKAEGSKGYMHYNPSLSANAMEELQAILSETADWGIVEMDKSMYNGKVVPARMYIGPIDPGMDADAIEADLLARFEVEE